MSCTLQVGAIGYAGDYPPLRYEGYLEYMNSLGHDDISEASSYLITSSSPPHLYHSHTHVDHLIADIATLVYDFDHFCGFLTTPLN